MPLAFLGALLLLLFLFPQWRQAVGRRPEAGQHISVSSGLHSPSHPLSLFISGKLTKGGPTIHLTAEPSHFFRGGGGATDLFLFLFRSDFLFFFFPLGRGERSSSKEGLQAETEQRGHFCIQTANGIGKVKSQLEEFTFLQCKIQLWNPVTWTFGLLCWGFTSPEWPVFISLASSLIKQCT